MKKEHFAATLEGKAVDWFSQYGIQHFPTYDSLKTAFLARFRKEKTPEDVLRKLRELQQKKSRVEDYSQKFRTLYNRLQANQRPTPEQLGDYFCKGLRRELRSSVAGRDIQTQADFTDMVNIALRAERRLDPEQGSV